MNVPCPGCDQPLDVDQTIPGNIEAEHPILYCQHCMVARGTAANALLGRRVKLRGSVNPRRVISMVDGDRGIMTRASGDLFGNPRTHHISDVKWIETEKGWKPA